MLADLAMAPMTPSNTARAGGILFPITLSVARAFGSEPGPTSPLIGAFLMKTLYQGDLVVSAMFLTATAPNPLIAELARQGSGVELSWTMWAMAASCLASWRCVVVPLVVYRLCPPGLHDTGPRSVWPPSVCEPWDRRRPERVMLAVFRRPPTLADERMAWRLADDRGVRRTVAAAADARARLAGCPRREGARGTD